MKSIRSCLEFPTEIRSFGWFLVNDLVAVAGMNEWKSDSPFPTDSPQTQTNPQISFQSFQASNIRSDFGESREASTERTGRQVDILISTKF